MNICPNCEKEYSDNITMCEACKIKLVHKGVEQEIDSIKEIIQGLWKRIKKVEEEFKHAAIKEISAEKLKLAEQRVEKKPVLRPVPSEETGEKLELRIGKVWLSRIGILAVIVGVGFFLKYAFENQWIGKLGRIVLGLLGGIGLIGLGEFYNRKDYKALWQSLTGGGICILYLSVFVAFNFYHFISLIPALIFMTLVTLCAITISVKNNSSAIAGLGILGGFIVPFVLGFARLHIGGLFIYILLLDVGILGINYFHKWKGFNLLTLSLTHFAYFGWYFSYYKTEFFPPALIFLFAVFSLFIFLSLLYNFIHRQLSKTEDLALIIFNGLLFFGEAIAVLRTEVSRNLLGFFAIFMAFIYLVIAQLAFLQRREDRNLILTHIGLGMLFLTIAVPIQLRQNWISLTWAMQALVLVWLGFKIESKGMRYCGLSLFSLVLIRLLFIDFPFDYATFHRYLLLFNRRSFTYLMIIGTMFISAKLYRDNKEKIIKGERVLSTIFVITANLSLLYLLTLECATYFAHLAQRQIPSYIQLETYKYRQAIYATLEKFSNLRRFSVSAVWAVYSLLCILVGTFRRFRALRLMGLVIVTCTIFKIFFIDLWELGKLYRIISSIGLGIILLFISFFYQRFKEKFL